MKTLLNKLLKTRSHPRRHPPKPTAGYTMIELLVGMVIAALIITPMLGFVVNVLNSDVKEQAKTNSEQELQLAIDYIAQDMSQAVYVYDPDYAGDATSDPAIPSYNDFIAQLPYPPAEDANDDKKPILVFWKREIVEDALAPSGGICEDTTEPIDCNDTFVLSLVAYYLRSDDSDTWCQPDGGICPKRISRFQIQDGVKDLSGNYVCGSDGRDETECDTDVKKKFMRDDGFNDYQSNPTEWTKDGDYNLNENKLDVLVNYIEGFDLNDVANNKLAKIEIVGNALRRSQNDFSCEVTPATATTPATYKNDPYCPKATAQVGARSGFGE